jgi:hypothetical protein
MQREAAYCAVRAVPQRRHRSLADGVLLTPAHCHTGELDAVWRPRFPRVAAGVKSSPVGLWQRSHRTQRPRAPETHVRASCHGPVGGPGRRWRRRHTGTWRPRLAGILGASLSVAENGRGLVLCGRLTRRGPSSRDADAGPVRLDSAATGDRQAQQDGGHGHGAPADRRRHIRTTMGLPTNQVEAGKRLLVDPPHNHAASVLVSARNAHLFRPGCRVPDTQAGPTADSRPVGRADSEVIHSDPGPSSHQQGEMP